MIQPLIAIQCGIQGIVGVDSLLGGLDSLGGGCRGCVCDQGGEGFMSRGREEKIYHGETEGEKGETGGKKENVAAFFCAFKASARGSPGGLRGDKS